VLRPATAGTPLSDRRFGPLWQARLVPTAVAGGLNVSLQPGPLASVRNGGVLLADTAGKNLTELVP
jgi:hypothetical protein